MKTIILFLVVVVAQVCWSQEIPVLTQILNQRTLGADIFFGRALAPAQSLEIKKTKLERIKAANQSLLSELNLVSNAFAKSTGSTAVASVYSAVQTIDAEIIGVGGHIVFSGDAPSAAQTRTLVLLPKNKIHSADPVNAVMDVLTSYKHSAKMSDFLYEYSEPQNLTVGSIVSTEGTDTSWVFPEAAAPFAEDKNFVLKKCRKLLGWRCITSLYRSEAITVGDAKTRVLFISLYDLDNNTDHADFAGDKRSKNQIT